MDLNYLFFITIALSIVVIIAVIAIFLKYQKERESWENLEREDLKKQGIFNIFLAVVSVYLFFTYRIDLLVLFIGIGLITSSLIFWNSKFAFFGYIPFKNESLRKVQNIITLVLGIGITIFGTLILFGLVK